MPEFSKHVTKMKRLIIPIMLLVLLLGVAACQDYETYGDMKAKERDAIEKYITKNNITVISESEFKARGEVTNLVDNEYVRLERTGVYMQIVRKGCGDKLENGKQVNLLCRFSEYNILQDSLVVCNNQTRYFYNSTLSQWIDGSQYIDVVSAKRTGTTITATFVTGMMLMAHSSSTSVPSGWLVPLNYVNVGRPEDADDEVSYVRLIVPHTQGTYDAQSGVYPCYYELTYQREN